MSKINTYKGVHDSDIPTLLRDLGLWEDFESGKVLCAFSNEVVTMDNLLGIFSDGNEIKFACDNEEARQYLAEHNRLQEDG